MTFITCVMRPTHNTALRALGCSLFLDHFDPEFQGQVFPFRNAQLPPESRGISLLKDIEIQTNAPTGFLPVPSPASRARSYESSAISRRGSPITSRFNLMPTAHDERWWRSPYRDVRQSSLSSRMTSIQSWSVRSSRSGTPSCHLNSVV